MTKHFDEMLTILDSTVDILYPNIAFNFKSLYL